MDNLLHYPDSTIVNRVVPKTMFYKFMEVNSRMKVRFVNDVANITWLYKLSASTLNVTDSEEMREIEVFVATLKQEDCPTDLFTFIDTNMPHHIVFVLLYGDYAMLHLNYKKWTDDSHTQFHVTQSFTSLWKPLSELSLAVQGQSLPVIYDNFVAQVSGIGDHKAGTMDKIVVLYQQIGNAEKEMQRLQRSMNQELQLDRKLQINKLVKVKRREIEVLKMKLETLKQ